MLKNHVWGVNPIGEGLYQAAVVELSDMKFLSVVFETICSSHEQATAELNAWLATHNVTIATPRHVVRRRGIARFSFRRRRH